MTTYTINVLYTYELDAEDPYLAEELAREELGELLGQLGPSDFGVEAFL